MHGPLFCIVCGHIYNELLTKVFNPIIGIILIVPIHHIHFEKKLQVNKRNPAERHAFLLTFLHAWKSIQEIYSALYWTKKNDTNAVSVILSTLLTQSSRHSYKEVGSVDLPI